MMDGGPRGEDGGSEAERFWEGHYRAHEWVWSGGANAVLVDIVGSLPPGMALDLGCGEGGDAIWLATRGWRVTAVDVSATALGRVAARAAATGVGDRVEVQRHDLGRTFPAGAFDLVSALYLQSPVAFPRDHVLRAAARAVGPGGLLLVVEHASIAPWSWNQDPNRSFPAPEEVLAVLDLEPGRWRTERLGAPEREATGPGGETATVVDNVVVVKRVAP